MRFSKRGPRTTESSPGITDRAATRQNPLNWARVGHSNPLTAGYARLSRRTELVISKKIFVGNLNFATTDQELRELFGEVGEVMDVHIPKDRESGRPRGFAFVRFAEEDQAAAAIEQFHGREVAGRAIRLDIAEDRPRPARPRRDFAPPPREPGFERSEYDQGGDQRRSHEDDDDGGRGQSFDRPKRPKGSRRGLRGKKRSL